MRRSKVHLISLIIPAYKQEKTIVRDLLRIKNVMDQLRYSYEIIVVVDGILDKTYQKAKKIKSSKIKIIGYKETSGKGHAVKFGMWRANGDIVAFIDAGMDINPNGISMLLEHLEWYNADIIVGSKLHPVSKVNYPHNRRLLSFGYRLLVKFLFGLSIRDTQVGIKFFRRKVLEKVLPRLLVKQYAFDIELLVVARYLGFKRIYEAPVDLKLKGSSSITSKDILTVILNMFLDTLAVFYRLNIKHYYHTSNRKHWKFDPNSMLRQYTRNSGRSS